jgi:uncharacterized membrane protein
VPRILLLAATVLTGLFAGFCFCYTVVVLPTLKQLGDEEYVSLMRRMNTVVPSVPFFLVFVGSLLCTLIALLLHRPLHPTTQTWLIAAAAAFVLATVVITVGIEVPLNGKLASAVTTGPSGFQQARQAFEGTWNAWHWVRTGTLVAALVLLVAGCLQEPARDAAAHAATAAAAVAGKTAAPAAEPLPAS